MAEIPCKLNKKRLVACVDGILFCYRKRKAGGGFTKLIRLSPALSTFLGVEAESRPQVVKKIWDYIKANNLQVPRLFSFMFYMHQCCTLPPRAN
jgi:chromatin remodeling complex protein RSC6